MPSDYDGMSFVANPIVNFPYVDTPRNVYNTASSTVATIDKWDSQDNVVLDVTGYAKAINFTFSVYNTNSPRDAYITTPPTTEMTGENKVANLADIKGRFSLPQKQLSEIRPNVFRSRVLITTMNYVITGTRIPAKMRIERTLHKNPMDYVINKGVVINRKAAVYLPELMSTPSISTYPLFEVPDSRRIVFKVMPKTTIARIVCKRLSTHSAEPTGDMILTIMNKRDGRVLLHRFVQHNEEVVIGDVSVSQELIAMLTDHDPITGHRLDSFERLRTVKLSK